MLKSSRIVSALGLLVILMVFANQVLVAAGSAGHWGYLITLQNEADESPAPTAQPPVSLSLQQFIERISPKAPDASDAINIPAPAGYPPQSAPQIAPAATLQPAQATPDPLPDAVYPPERIQIPSIGLVAPVVSVKSHQVTLYGQKVDQWLPPDLFAAGWHSGSASLGKVGNTVLNGHNNIYGGVFDKLHNVAVGDTILMDSGNYTFEYQVTNTMTLKEKYESLGKRLQNAQWLLASSDERLTLVTCWPPNTNLYRLVVVARPVSYYPSRPG